MSDLKKRFAGLSPAKQALMLRKLKEREAARQKDEPAGLQESVIEPRAELGPPPLSFAQQRLWFLDRFVPGLNAYNIGALLRLDGTLDRGALEAAWRQIVSRHAVLRARFEELDGEPAQRFVPVTRFEPSYLPSYVDLCSLAAADRERVAQSQARQEQQRVFDLTEGPLVRMRLWQVDDDAHLLLLVVHHIATDGWSMGVMIKELAEFYAASVAGRESRIPPLAIQYGDFANWQHQQFKRGAFAGQLDYWRGQLDHLPTLELPLDRPRTAEQRFVGAFHRVVLEPRSTERLRGLAKKVEGGTLFMALLSAWVHHLQRHAGPSGGDENSGKQRDVVIGTPIANRNRPEIEPLIGFFVNTLVLRLPSDPAWTFEQALAETRRVAIEAYKHQDLPFEKLVALLQPERQLSTAPLFQVSFALQNAPLPPLALPELKLSRLPLEAPTTMFDLSLTAVEDTQGLWLELRYSPALFDATHIERLAEQYRRLLIRVGEEAARPLAEIDILSPAERQMLMVEWADGDHDPPRLAIPGRFLARCDASPEAVAVQEEDVQLSFALLVQEAMELARALRQRGAKPEAVVAVLAERRPRILIDLLATWLTGAAVMPLDPALPSQRFAFMLQDAEAVAFLGDASSEHRQQAEALLVESAPAVDEFSAIDVDPRHLAYVIYTSGSTGQPKGVAVSHAQVLPILDWGLEIFHLNPESRILQGLSPAFDFGLFELITSWLSGGRLIFPGQGASHDPARYPALVARHRADILHTTPSFINEVVELATGETLRTLRVAHLGGELLRPNLVARIQARIDSKGVVYNGYGPTETSVNCAICPVSVTELGAYRDQISIPIGRGTAANRAQVQGARGRLVPLGVSGELCIGGDSVARGYLNRPRLTAERFVPDATNPLPGARLYRSGDRVRYRADGRLDFLGRLDHQIKLRGFRVELGEIEAWVHDCAGVREAQVLLRQDAPGGPALLAVVLPEEARDVSPQSLFQDCREELAARVPDYMIPTFFLALEAWPLNPNGKIDRAALMALPLEAEASKRGENTGWSPTADLLAGQFAEVLGLDTVSFEGHFFRLGGHSLLGVRLLARLQRAFGVEISLRELFETPTVNQLARRIDERRRAGVKALPAPEPLPRPWATAPVSLAQERLWFLEQLEPESAAYHLPLILRLGGWLSVSRLSRAVASVIERHEILRCRVIALDDRPVLAPISPERLALPTIDLTRLDEGDRESQIAQQRKAVQEEAFDLASGPLLRLALWRDEERSHIFAAILHHIITDGWSMGIFARELAAFYADPEARLEPLPAQFADHAAWQRKWLEGERLDAQLDVWKQELEGALTTLDLPRDRPRPTEQSFRGAHVARRLEGATVDGLRGLARQLDATLFMVLVTAFALLLSRLSGQQDLLLGTPSSGRGQAEVEGLIGFFINTLVLRANIDDEQTFTELVERMRETVLTAFAHQDLPFERLVQALNVQRDLSRTPLFQVFFNLLNFKRERIELADLTFEALPAGDPPSKFDLTLYAVEQETSIAFSAVYNADLFTEARMEALIDSYLHLLGELVENAARPVSDYTLSAHSFDAVNATFAEVYRESEASLPELFARVAKANPKAIALRDAEGTWTFSELRQVAWSLAVRLHELGAAGEIVAIWGRRDRWLVASMLGVARAGAAFCVLDPAHPTARQLDLLEQTKTRLLIHLDREPLPFEVREHCEIVDPSDVNETQPDFPPPNADDPLSVLFTSGSTGKPKGVVGQHRPVVAFLAWYQRQLGLSSGHRFALLSGLGHDPLLRDLWTPLVSGGELHIPPTPVRSEPLALWSWLREHRVNILHLTPSMAEFIARGAPLGERLDALQWVVFGGEPLSFAQAARFRARAGESVSLINAYGTTETPQIMAFHQLDGERRDVDSVPIGRGRDGVEVWVLNRAGERCAVGELGEIVIRSPFLAKGYLNDKEATAERFSVEEGSVARRYSTGDLGRYLPDGAVEIAGRADQQLKIRGHRIEPGEIENLLLALPSIDAAVVVARRAPDGDPRLVAYLVTDDDEPELWRRALAERLPEALLPSRFERLPALPLTANGKVDREALPEPSWEADAVFHEEPRTALERGLAKIWREVLAVSRVGRQDDFFALGGHSLLATRLVARVRQECGVKVPLRQLFQTPTLAALASWLEAQQVTARAEVDALPSIEPDWAALHEPFPMTDVQQAYWIGRSSALELGNVATHSYMEIDSEELSVDRLEVAWQVMIERHGMLRAVMLPDGRQRILKQIPEYRLARLDLRQSPAEEVDRALAEVREELSHQVLDPERWPLFDLRVSLLPGGTIRLHVSRDALLYDAWSLRLILRELVHLYHGGELPPAPVLSFRDYVLAEQALVKTDVYARSVAYWQERLDTLPTGPDLPLARQAAQLTQPSFERRTGQLDAVRWSRFKARAQAAGVTPSSVLLATFAQVLAHWSKSPRFTLNLTLFNRLPFHPEVDRLVGDFTSLTLLEIDASGEIDLTSRARRLQERLWQDLDHRYVGGVWVMRELSRRQGGGLRARLPVVFTSTLGMANNQEKAPEPLGRPVYSISQTPQVWLDHQAAERDGELHFNWDAVEALFPSGLLDDMFTAYVARIEELAEDAASWDRAEFRPQPATPIMVTDFETVPRGLLHQPFLRQAAERPDALAVIDGDIRLTYGELLRLSRSLAWRLRDSGARPNRLIAVWMEKGWEQVVAVLAILEAGAAYLPIDAHLPAERRDFLLENGEVELVLTQPHLRSTHHAAGLDERGAQVVDVVRDTGFETGSKNLDPLPIVQQPTDLAYVIFTSGSTGQPKGVMIDHRGALNTVIDVNKRFNVGAEDRVLALSELHFDLSVYDVFGLLAAGGAIVLPAVDRRRDPAHWTELIEGEGVTLWNSVPALLEMWVESFAAGRRVEDRLRLVLLSGDWIPVTLPDRLRALVSESESLRLISLGGATEGSIWSILYPIQEVDSSWSSIPYGRAMGNQSFHVLDDNLNPRPTWVPGELFIGGIGVALGYWRDPERTAKSFIIHPKSGERLYRTGDWGRFLPSGEIEFLGREDLQVKVRGHRIELGEIEAVLSRQPELRDGVVVVIGDPRGARRLAGFAIPVEGTEVGVETLRDILVAKLPAYMVPSLLLLRDELPLTGNGKVDRAALERLALAAEVETAKTFRVPTNETEERIAETWAAVLKLDRISIDDNFFEIGGDSVLAIQLLTRLNEAGLRLPSLAVFEHQTIRALAKVVRVDENNDGSLGGAASYPVVGPGEVTTIPVKSTETSVAPDDEIDVAGSDLSEDELDQFLEGLLE